MKKDTAEDIFAVLMTIAAILFLSMGLARAGSQTVSGQTVDNMIDRVRVELNDSTSSLVSDADFIKWTNEAQWSIASIARCIETTETVAMTTGAYSITVSTDYFDIETAIWDNGESTDKFRYRYLAKVDPKIIFSQPEKTGNPQYWYQWDDKLYIWPVPSTVEDGTSLIILAISQPSALTAVGNSIATPYYFDTAILYYLKAKYCEADMKEARAAYYQGLYKNELAAYLAEIRNGVQPAK